MLDLIELYQKSPYIKKISLQLRSIKDVTQMVNLLSKFKYLKEISLHGNQLKSIPPLNSLQQLSILDVSNNPLKVDNFLLDRLFQIPKLQHLIIDISQVEKKVLVDHLPKLQSLNRIYINRQAIKKATFEEQRIILGDKLNEEMNKTKDLYRRLNSLIDNSTKEAQEQQLDKIRRQQDLNFLCHDIQEQMAYFYEGLQDRLSREGVFAYSKNKFTTILDSLMIRVIDELGNQNAVKIYEEICRVKAQNFDALLRIIFTSSYQKYIGDQLSKSTNRLRKENLYLNQIFRMKKEVSEIRTQNAKIDRISNQQTSVKDYTKAKGSILNSTPKQSSSRSLLKSNSKAQGLSKTSRTPLKMMRKSPSNALNRSPSKVLNKSPSGVLRKSPNKVFKKTPGKVLNKSQTNRSLSSRQVVSQSQNEHKINIQTQRQTQTLKIVSLEQLTTLIQEIMDDKRKYNNKNYDKGQSYETTQEFLYSFFSRKYGLKHLALDWSLSTIKSIEKYCRESIEVEVFGKILKNQLYEQYYDECKKLKQQIRQVFKKQKISQELSQQQFQKIFIYFFSFEDNQTINNLVTETSFPVKMQQMVYFLQSYKLAFEEKHLRPFNDIFNQVDQQGQAYLNQDQCRFLANELVKEKEQKEKDKFLRSVDKMLSLSKKDKFIYSQVFQMIHSIL